PVLVPDPDVLELELEERKPARGARRRLLNVEPVTEVRRVLRQHAEAEKREDGLVLLLQRELELGLVLVEIVQVRHRGQCTPPNRDSTVPLPGTMSPGSSSASGSRTKRHSCRRGCGTVRPGSSIRSSPSSDRT